MKSYTFEETSVIVSSLVYEIIYKWTHTNYVYFEFKCMRLQQK